MKSKINQGYHERKSEECLELLGGGNGGAGGIFDGALVGAPGGAEEIDDVELFGEPV